jgi:5-amino-6-(5-phosphoribosylamino)uracil reductase
VDDWPARFERFAERKTREALDAELPPYVTELENHEQGLIAIGNDWSRRLFDGDFYLAPSPNSRRPACSLVFVQSLDGNTGARNPSVLGGGETDKHLIYEGLSRVAADAVLGGAETIRGGRIVFSVWHPELVRLRQALGKPRHPLQVIATLRGLDMQDELLFNVPDIRVLVLTVGACATLMRERFAARPWITPIVMDKPSDLPEAFERLRALGIERISAIGGRNVATQLIDAGLVHEVYLTTAPRPGGEPNTPMYPRPLNRRVVVRKRGTGPESGVVFEHFLLQGRHPRL